MAMHLYQAYKFRYHLYWTAEDRALDSILTSNPVNYYLNYNMKTCAFLTIKD